MAPQPKADGVPLTYLKLAHAVQIAGNTAQWFDAKYYDLTLHANLIITITNKVAPGSTVQPETVYTSVMNAISWKR